MNRSQKIAWSFIVCIALAVVASVAVVNIMYKKVGMPRAMLGFSLIGLGGFGCFAPLLFRRKKGDIIDERDQMIQRNAAFAGFAAAFLFAGAGCMIPYFTLGPEATIPVRFLPMIWIIIFMSQFFFYSVSILIQYGKGQKGEKS
jgi:hypothetical protein